MGTRRAQTMNFSKIINYAKYSRVEQNCYIFSALPMGIKALRPRQNGCHITDDICKCISWNENFWILNKISMKYVT